MITDHDVRDAVSPAVFNEFTKLPEDKRQQIAAYFADRKKSVGMGYLFLCLIFGSHYGYMKEWGTQVGFWLTIGGLGIWSLMDLFRMKSLIVKANDKILFDIIAQCR